MGSPITAEKKQSAVWSYFTPVNLKKNVPSYRITVSVILARYLHGSGSIPNFAELHTCNVVLMPDSCVIKDDLVENSSLLVKKIVRTARKDQTYKGLQKFQATECQK